MQKGFITTSIILAVTALSLGGWNYFSNHEEITEASAQESSVGGGVFLPVQGGTGISTKPSLGEILVGNSANGYDLVATSTLGAGEANTISTSTSETAGQIPYWTTTSASPALLGSIATTSATIGTGLSYSGTFGSLVGGVTGTLSLDNTGDWAGTFDGQEGSYYLDATNLTNFGIPFYNFFNATTTDALSEGSSNLYFTDTRARAVAGWEINPSGNLTPTTTPLTIEISDFIATSTTATSTIAGGLAIETDGFVYDYSTGMVGIGTASPKTSLHIQNGGGDGTFTIGQDLGFGTAIAMQIVHSGTNVFFERRNNDGGLAPDITLSKTRGTVTNPTVIVSGDTLGLFNFRGHDGINALTIGASFGAISEGVIASNKTPAYLHFDTAPGIIADDVTERMRITSEGLIGIGTTSPYAKLSVVGQTVAEYFTATSTTATSTLPNLSLTNLLFGSDYVTDLVGNGLSLVGGALTVATSTFDLDPNLIDLTQGWTLMGDTSNKAIATSTLFIAESGNVGIGTTTPLAPLVVVGIGNATSTLTLGATTTPAEAKKPACVKMMSTDGDWVYMTITGTTANWSTTACN
jgi:hypothetical protein